MKKSQVFNDPIHGSIELPIVCVKIINTPEFQRLKNLKQLGGNYFVYPGASYNRFEHSIGVCHLAGELVKQLQQQLVNEPDEKLPPITDKEVLYVQIAGLCHDLGHGPYSHLFDRHFYPAVTAAHNKEEKWSHEDFSVLIMKRILENLLQENQGEKDVKEQLEDALANIDVIKKMVHDKKKDQEPEKEAERSFLYEIVANSTNGVDVDKWDYFARDCHYLGLSSTFDCRRLIKFARVIKVNGKTQICYRDKEVHNLYEMYHVRDILYRRVYYHKTTLIIEHMLAEALVEANDILKVVFRDSKQPTLSDCINNEDIETYLKLDDSIFWFIQQIKTHLEQDDCISWLQKQEIDPEKLRNAHAILENIIRRRHHRFLRRHVISDAKKLDEKLLQKGLKLDYRQQKKWSESKELKQYNVLVKVAKFDYFKGENPVASVLFYRKERPNEAEQILPEEVSLMLPPIFKEYVFFFYDKDLNISGQDETKKKEDKMNAIENFIETHLSVEPEAEGQEAE